LPEAVDLMVAGYTDNPDILKTLANISFKDYTTVIHSVNVMALTIGFCFFCNYSGQDTKEYGLSALLHDVGKTQVPSNILKAKRRLSFEEFEIVKSHTTIGGSIIENSGDIDNSIAQGAFEHHEKLDGSGYPKGIAKISFIGQLLGIVDCYEAITNDDRLYPSVA